MRVAGTSLMVVGAAVMVLAATSLFGMNVRVNGSDMFPAVLSAPAAFVGGVILIIGGAWLRRRAKRNRASDAAV